MNRFPDFNTWHKVPDGITIPEGTPVWAEYYGGAWGLDVERGTSANWCIQRYIERPITDPDEAANWKKAEKMYRTAYSSLDDAWEYQSQDTKDRWYTLAKKYDEKED